MMMTDDCAQTDNRCELIAQHTRSPSIGCRTVSFLADRNNGRA